MLSIVRGVVVLVLVATSSATAAPIRLETLGVEIEADAGWQLGPAKDKLDVILINDGALPMSLFATPGGSCKPSTDSPATCPAGITCTRTRIGETDALAYCAQVPGGALQAVRPRYELESFGLTDAAYAVVTRTRDAVAKLRTTTPWVRRAAVSGLDLAISGDASWETTVENDFKLFSGSPERVDALARVWPAPRIEMQFVVRERNFDCDALRTALLKNELMNEVPHADWPSEVRWVVRLAAEKADGTGILRADTACARMPSGTLLLMAQTDGEGSYLEVVRAIVGARSAGTSTVETSYDPDEDSPTEKGLQMGRFYVQGFGARGEGFDDRYGARFGLELWADLNAERAVSPIFGFGLSGSANSKLELGFDARLALGGGIDAGPFAIAVLATAGADRVTPVDGAGLYAGLEALLSIALGGASLGTAAQWNTREYRGLVQVTLKSGVAFGAEWMRNHDAMTPSDMYGIYIGVGPP